MGSRQWTAESLARLTRLLREDPRVEEAVVTLRRDLRGVDNPVVYLVPNRSVSTETLREDLKGHVPEDWIPPFWVAVTSLPLTSEGRVDRVRLSRLPVLEPSLLKSWEERLGACLGVRAVRVVPEQTVWKTRRLHLWDLLESSLDVALAAGARDDTREGRHSRQGGEGEAAGSCASDPPRLPRRPAFSDGGPLCLPDAAPRTLTEALLGSAAERPGKGIRFRRRDEEPELLDYARLLDGARVILAGLRREGLGAGDRLVLQLERLSDHFTAFWACLLGGVAPVTVAVPPVYRESDAISRKLLAAWEQLERPPILARGEVAESLRRFSTDSSLGRLEVLDLAGLEGAAPVSDLHTPRPEDVAFFQLTSGTTGRPKCIQITHGGVVAHVHGSREAQRLGGESVFLNWLRVDHVVPILTFHLKGVYLGLDQVEVSTEAVLTDPLVWLDEIHRFRVTHTWAPNFAFRLVADAVRLRPDRTWDLSCVKSFMNAGEQVTLPVVRDFLSAVEPFGVRPVALQPAFGMAEVCTCMAYEIRFDPEGSIRRLVGGEASKPRHGRPPFERALPVVTLGPPTPGVGIRIVDGRNRVIEEGRVGRLQLRGEVVTPGYYGNPEADAAAFVGEGWFDSGDLGFILDGELAVTGREKEKIVLRGENFSCFEIEQAVEEVEGVLAAHAAACTVPDPVTGTDELVVFFSPVRESPEPPLALVREIRRSVSRQTGISPEHVVPLPAGDFPRTTSGKVQRGRLAELFRSGAFREIRKALDLGLGNRNTLPDWFLRRGWKRRELSHDEISSMPSPPSCCLLVGGDGVLEPAVAERLERRGVSVVRVEAGSAFARWGPRRYRVRPGERDDWRRLAAEVRRSTGGVKWVLRFWGADRSDSGEPSSPESLRTACEALAGLVNLAVALEEEPGEQGAVGGVIASRRTQAFDESDAVFGENASVLGVIRTLSLECSRVRFRAVELPGEGGEQMSPDRLVDELLSSDRQLNVAYRNGGRYVRRLTRVSFPEEAIGDAPFRPGGFYVVSGGLGGIGQEVVRFLLGEYGARLLLLGATPLAPSGLPAKKNGRPFSSDDRGALVRDLARLGGEVRYKALDVSDPVAVGRAVAETEELWQTPVEGAIHLAGRYRERTLREESAESLAALIGPKLLGARSLNEALRHRPGAFLLLFSSLFGDQFGGVLLGAYSASNSAVEAFAREVRRREGRRVWCFSWSNWKGVGMSRHGPGEKVLAGRGFQSIWPRAGILSLLAGIRSGHADLMVGLDEQAPPVRPLVDAETVPLEVPVARLVVTPGFSGVPDEVAPPFRDRFGTEVSCALHAVEAGADEAGDGALGLLKDSREAATERSAEPPASEMEELVATVWREVLGLSRVGRRERFLVLGGNSLQAIRIAGRLGDLLEVEVPVGRLLAEGGTIAEMARLLQELPEPGDPDSSHSGGGPVRGVSRESRNAQAVKPGE